MSNWKAAHIAHLSSVRAAKAPSGTSVLPSADKPATARKKPRQEEAAMQVALFRWFAYAYPEYAGHFFAVPNGGQRSKATAARLKAEGVLSGVSDCVLAVVSDTAFGLFLELKVGKNKPSEAQALFLSRMKAQGYATAVAYSFDAARDAVRAHLGY